MNIFQYCLLAIFLSLPAFGQEQVNLKEGSTIYPARPDGSRDWQASYYRVEKGEAVPIRSDGQRDWNANVYRVEGDYAVPVRPNGQRDWQVPAARR